MRGVEKEDPHSLMYPVDHPVHINILHIVVMHMSPPDEYVRVVQYLRGQALLRIREY